MSYLLAFLAVAAATLARLFLGNLLGPQFSAYLTYYPVVLLAALFGGIRPGLFSTGLASLAIAYFFLSPAGSLAIEHPGDKVGLLLFIAINFAVSLVGGALRSARHRTFAEARRAEASEERFRLFMDNTPTLAWVKDEQGRYTYINRAYEQRFGRTLAQCQGKTDQDLWPAEIAARLQKADEAALAMDHPTEVTEEVTEPDGSVSSWLNTKFPIRDAAGRRFIASIGVDITERKRAETALRSSEERFRKALSAPTVGALFFSLDGHIQEANPAFERMSGYTTAELRRLHWEVLAAPEGREATLAHVTEMAEKGETAPYLKPMVRKDGTHWWGLFAPTRLSGSGTATQCMEFIVDMTEQKATEAALHENEARLRLAVETAELGMYERDLITNDITLNPACQAIFGVAEPFPPDVARRALHPQDRDRIFAEAARAFDPELRAICTAEFRIVRPDGTTRWVAGRGRVLFDDREKPPQPRKFIGVLNDITERKRYEDSLCRSEASLSQAIRVARLGIFDSDHIANVISLSPEARELFGFSPNQPLTIADVLQCIPVPYRDQVAFAIHHSHDPVAGGLLETEHPIVRPGRETRWVSVRAQTLFEGHGPDRHAVRSIGALLDITAQKHQADTLTRLVQDRTAKLEQTVAELEHFSYTITHDMRAPLRAMTGFASLLDTHYARELSEEARDLLQRISESALRMDQLITDALQFSRVLNVHFELKPLDAFASVCGIVKSYPQFQPPHAQITVEHQNALVLANEAALTQVFSNLLGNAVKFVTPGQVPQVKVSAELRGSFVRFWVSDNGIGIGHQYHAKIWQMFQRLDKSYEGTGIGLALVQKVVERMGGKVGLESSPGQGSRFWVELRKAS